MSSKPVRIDRVFPMLNYSKKSGYDWQKLLGAKTVRRNEWLSKTWAKLYFENSCDEYLRNLSTDELMKTKWFEKYGVKEPSFD